MSAQETRRRPGPLVQTSHDPTFDARVSPEGSDMWAPVGRGFAETTNEAAAKALAKFYAEQARDGGETESVVQTRVDENGRTVYRVKPIADSPISPSSSSSATSSHIPFARPSHQPMPAATRPKIALYRSSLRQSRSIPALRSTPLEAEPSPSPALLSPTAAAFHTAQTSAANTNRLRRIGSSPTLNSTPAFVQQSSHDNRDSSRSSSYEGDVLGRILGWREDVTLQQHAGLKTGTATKSRREGTARVGLPDLFRRKGSAATGSSGGKRGRKGSALSTAETDTTDLPDDLVEELDTAFDATRLDHPLASPPKRPSFARGPFGTGIRIPRAVSQVPLGGALWTTQGEASSPRPPHPMREVASNDSIRTARADDALPQSQPSAPRLRYQDPTVFDVFHRPAGLSSPPLPPADLPHNIPFGHHGRLPSSASLASARSSGSHASGQQITVVPAAGDDPRFVIWGLKNGSRQPVIPTSPPTTSSRRGSAAPPVTPGKSVRRDSAADGARDQVGSPASSVTGSPAPSARRWSISQRGSGPVSSPATSVRDSVGSAKNTPLPPSPSAQRVLMAASVERLVAELTSQISSDLLTDFFLTFRHFIAPVDLLHLLISRFDWAMKPSTQPQGGLSSSSSSSSLAALAAEDDALRRVVRVRTFVVIRYWLLNHFMDDFFPSRELRTTLTVWLNNAARDERFRSSPKDARLIKGLKKTARKCKEAYILGATSAAVATSGTSPALGAPEDELDLDLASVPVNGTSTARPHDLGSRTKTRLFATSSPSSPPRLHSSVNAPFPLPDSTSQQNPIARSFSSAIGSIGRIKRKLGAATKGQTAHEHSGSRKGFEMTDSAEGDLLRIEGGLEKYLEYWDIKRELDAVVDDQEVTPTLTSNASTFETDEIASPEPDVVHDPEQCPPAVVVDQSSGLGLGIAGVDEPVPIASTDYAFPAKPTPVPISAEPSYSADSTTTLPAPLPSTTPGFILRPGAFGHVASFDRRESVRIELDDLDDSDEDEDVIEAKRTLKRLPAAQDLRFVADGSLVHAQLPLRQSIDSETSDLLRRSTRGPAPFDWTRDDQPRESVLFVDDEEGVEPGVATVPNFILEGLVDSDDEEPGDVEAALRRLEGLVDDTKEQEKARRVAMQMEKSSKLEEERRRLVEAGEVEDSVEMDVDAGAPLVTPAHDDVVASAARLPDTLDLPPPSSTAPAESRCVETIASPRADQALPSAPSTKLTPQLVAPEPPTFRKPSISRIFRPFSTRPALRPTPSVAPAHRSFILFCKAETLAQQFALIERDMLRMLSYTELASGSWQDRIGETDVHDWEVYVKERRRADLVAKEKGTQPSSAVQDVIARFNLTANWVCSEILLTASIDERAILLAKFIRLAFKCYCMSNFQTLTQIVHGLQIPDVERLRKTWAKVPSWEMRKFRGMQVFVSHLKNFKYLRAVTNALVATEAGLPAARSGSFDSTTAAAAKGCIPFLGIFLRDLALNAELPTFLDPTEPDIPAEVDAAGSLVSLADPSAFEELPPLPPSISLVPLVNVHKFRVLASTVRQVVAFQDLANRYTFEPTPSVFFKCLKIRSLKQDVMHALSRKLEA